MKGTDTTVCEMVRDVMALEMCSVMGQLLTSVHAVHLFSAVDLTHKITVCISRLVGLIAGIRIIISIKYVLLVDKSWLVKFALTFRQPNLSILIGFKVFCRGVPQNSHSGNQKFGVFPINQIRHF